MGFDNETRNKLSSLVTQCRKLLTEEFTKQCQEIYGIQPDTGEITPLEELSRLEDKELSVAISLRERVEYLASNLVGKETITIAIDRMLREQAFTVMNRLAAMKMADGFHKDDQRQPKTGMLDRQMERGMPARRVVTWP